MRYARLAIGSHATYRICNNCKSLLCYRQGTPTLALRVVNVSLQAVPGTTNKPLDRPANSDTLKATKLEITSAL